LVNLHALDAWQRARSCTIVLIIAGKSARPWRACTLHRWQILERSLWLAPPEPSRPAIIFRASIVGEKSNMAGRQWERIREVMRRGQQRWAKAAERISALRARRVELPRGVSRQ
jgi:hypothetical protein